MATTVRTLIYRLWVDWNFDTIYTDETVNLIGAQGEMRLIPIGASIFATQGIISQCTVTLFNRKEGDGGRRYSSLDNRSDLYSNLQFGNGYHVPMYLEISTDGGSNYHRIFTGVMKIPAEAVAALQGVGQVTLDCRSREDQYLNHRITTTHSTFRTNVDSGVTESGLMAQWLQQVGLTSADYVLDEGLYTIPYPWLDNASVIESCWTLAAACGGRFYARPDGKFAYENAYHWIQAPHSSTPAVTWGKGHYQRLRPRWVDAELYNQIEVSYTPYEVGETSTLWEANEVIVIPPTTNKTITAQFNGPAYAIDTATWKAVTPGGQDKTSSVTLTQTNYAQRASLQFSSGATESLYIPNAKITGKAISATNTTPITLSNTASWASFWANRGGRTRVVNNTFIQTRGHAEALCEMMRDWHERPRMFFAVDGAGLVDASIRLGDRIRINDADAMNANNDMMLTAINWSIGRNGFITNLEGVNANTLMPFYVNETLQRYFIVTVDSMTATVTGSEPRVGY